MTNNKIKWEKLLKNPDWYIQIVPELEIIKKEASFKSQSEKENIAEEVYSFFENKLNNGDIALGDKIGNWDKERKPIDTIVIHHTEMVTGLTKDRLSAITLVRLYASYYAKPYDKREIGIVGQPISSGHVRDGKQVFWPYHWMVRMNGKIEQLLYENEIGWHAGNWGINCRSAAIVLDNNYVNSRPNDKVLEAVAGLIRSKYNYISKEKIYGHREVRLLGSTSCPSNLFLSKDNYRGWKEDLLTII